MDQKEIAKLLTPKEKDALAVLISSGFMAFTECKIEETRELSTGRRRPTWRNAGRWDLVVGFKKLAEREPPELDEIPDADEVLTPAVPPVEAMNREALLLEAKNYPDLIGEYKMKVDELRAAIKEQRELRRELIHRKFEL